MLATSNSRRRQACQESHLQCHRPGQLAHARIVIHGPIVLLMPSLHCVPVAHRSEQIKATGIPLFVWPCHMQSWCHRTASAVCSPTCPHGSAGQITTGTCSVWLISGTHWLSVIAATTHMPCVRRLSVLLYKCALVSTVSDRGACCPASNNLVSCIPPVSSCDFPTSCPPT